jgi:hypothetical protein
MTVELIDQLKAWAGDVYLMPQFHKYDMIAEIVEKYKGYNFNLRKPLDK